MTDAISLPLDLPPEAAFPPRLSYRIFLQSVGFQIEHTTNTSRLPLVPSRRAHLRGGTACRNLVTAVDAAGGNVLAAGRQGVAIPAAMARSFLPKVEPCTTARSMRL